MKTCTRDEVVEQFQTTEGLEEVLVSYGDDESFSCGTAEDTVSFKLGKEEHEVSDLAYLKACRMIGIGESLIKKFPPPVVLPMLNHYYSKTKGEMKILLDRDGKVVAFTKSAVAYFSNVQLLEAVEHSLQAKFGNGVDLKYHHVHNDLGLTRFTVVSPRAEHKVRQGDALNYGVSVKTSILGECPIRVSGYVFRLVCTNGAVSTDNVFTFSRRMKSQTVPSWVEDAVGLAADKAEEEFNRVDVLAKTPLDSSVGKVVSHLFSDNKLPKDQREAVQAALLETGVETLYDVYNALTSVANDERVSGNPLQALHLQEAAGSLAIHPEYCGSCHRMLEN